jgi:uncharacterized membrane protein
MILLVIGAILRAVAVAMAISIPSILLLTWYIRRIINYPDRCIDRGGINLP